VTIAAPELSISTVIVTVTLVIALYHPPVLDDPYLVRVTVATWCRNRGKQWGKVSNLAIVMLNCRRPIF